MRVRPEALIYLDLSVQNELECMKSVNRLLTKNSIDATLNYKFDLLEQITVFEFIVPEIDQKSKSILRKI